MTKVAIYSRVSTDKQDNLNQLQQLTAFAESQPGWTLAFKFIDTCTGGTSDREQFQKMFQAAERKEFDLLLFWSLDRLTREGTLATLLHLDRLQKAGVKYQSLQEKELSTDNPFLDVFISLRASIAKQEKVRISERTKAGLMQARARGMKLGGSLKRDLDESRIMMMYRSGATIRQISQALDVPRATLYNRIAMLEAA